MDWEQTGLGQGLGQEKDWTGIKTDRDLNGLDWKETV